MTNPNSPSSRLTTNTRSDLWFADGNIIIQVSYPDKTQERLYKLHRGVLGHHSTIFKDLFEVASSNSSQTFEGLPFVDLHDDPADLDYFLRALYDPLWSVTLIAPSYALSVFSNESQQLCLSR